MIEVESRPALATPLLSVGSFAVIVGCLAALAAAVGGSHDASSHTVVAIGMALTTAGVLVGAARSASARPEA